MFKFLKKKEKKLIIKKIRFLNHFYSSNLRFLEVMRDVFGINYYIALQINKIFGFSYSLKFGLINQKQLKIIGEFFMNYLLINRGLRRFRNSLLMERNLSGCIRGVRLLNGLPINGQRTHTNSKTVRKIFRMYKFLD